MLEQMTSKHLSQKIPITHHCIHKGFKSFNIFIPHWQYILLPGVLCAFTRARKTLVSPQIMDKLHKKSYVVNIETQNDTKKIYIQQFTMCTAQECIKIKTKIQSP